MTSALAVAAAVAAFETGATNAQAATVNWAVNGNTGWLTPSNWSTTTTYAGNSNVTGSGLATDVANFSDDGVIGVVGIGVNFGSSGVNGGTLTLAAITSNLTSLSTTSPPGGATLLIGNSSTTSTAGTFRLNGAPVNVGGTGGSLNNVVAATLDGATRNLQFANQSVGSNANQVTSYQLGNAAPVFYTTGSTSIFVSGTLSQASGVTARIQKNGAGTLSLTGGNSTTGGVHIYGGAIQGADNVSMFGAGPAVGSASIPTHIQVDGGTIIRTDSGSSVFAGTTRGMTIDAGGATIQMSNALGAWGMSASITGQGGLTKTGLGKFTLNGANSYQGVTTLNAGTLSFGTATSLGTGNFTINGGSIDSNAASLNMSTSTNTQSWNNDFAFVGTNGLTLPSGNVTLSKPLTVTTSASTLSVPGAIDGSFVLSKAGAGKLQLRAPNTHAGVNLTAGTLGIGHSGALGTGEFNIGDGTTIEGTNAVNVTTNNTVNVNGNFSFSGNWFNLTLGNGDFNLGNATRTITTTAGGARLLIGGKIIGSGGIIKEGAGTLTLSNGAGGSGTSSGANTYSGGVTLNAGTLSLIDGNALGTGTLTINGGTLDRTGTGNAVMSTNNAQIWGGDFTFASSNNNSLNLGTGNVTLTGDRTVTTNNTGTLTIGGAISGGFKLTKAGTGKLALNGNNAFSGGTQIDAGTLTLGGTLANANITVASGATLDGTGTINFDINNDTPNTFTSAGIVDITSLKLDLDFIGTQTPNTPYTILSGSYSGTAFAEVQDLGDYQITYGTNAITIMVPEPTSLTALGLVGVMGLRRRRKSA